jgi:hypothetical protein
MPWRKSGVKYSQNEIYLDIVEEMDAIIDSTGQVGNRNLDVIISLHQAKAISDYLTHYTLGGKPYRTSSIHI